MSAAWGKIGKFIERWQGILAFFGVLGTGAFVANGYDWTTPHTRFDHLDHAVAAVLHHADSAVAVEQSEIDTMKVRQQFVMEAFIGLCLEQRQSKDASLRVPCYSILSSTNPHWSPP